MGTDGLVFLCPTSIISLPYLCPLPRTNQEPRLILLHRFCLESIFLTDLTVTAPVFFIKLTDDSTNPILLTNRYLLPSPWQPCYGRSEADTLSCMARVMTARAAGNMVSVEDQVHKDMATWMKDMTLEQQRTVEQIYTTCWAMEDEVCRLCVFYFHHFLNPEIVSQQYFAVKIRCGRV